jgi:hypothetical protein
MLPVLSPKQPIFVSDKIEPDSGTAGCDILTGKVAIQRLLSLIAKTCGPNARLLN